MSTAKRYFTVAEANAMIPSLERSLRQLQELKRDLQHRYQKLQDAKLSLSGPPHQAQDMFFQEEAELEFIMFSANSMLQQILATGVEVKDIDTGLCDFNALMHGQEVYLCWRLGEPSVMHWHGLYEGMMGRKEIWDEVDFDHE